MKKYKALLQKMVYGGEGFIPFECVCLVDLSTRGGEYTICGNAIPDSHLDSEGFEAIGNEYYGSIKEVNCPRCSAVIEYIKSLK